MRLMFVGAHPDDAEFHAGGLMCAWRAGGGEVRILCLTDGSAGHHSMQRAELAARRKGEAEAAASLIGASVEVWNVADGELTTDLAHRKRLIGAIRNWPPDLIVTHRPADYHPDHRAAGQLVQDAAYLLQVPNIVPDTTPLASLPCIVYAADRFKQPQPFRADWVVDTGTYLDAVTDLLDCHASQVYEWLPHVQNLTLPAQDRKGWLRQWYRARPARLARKYAAAPIEYAEAFEASEYGAPFDPLKYHVHE